MEGTKLDIMNYLIQNRRMFLMIGACLVLFPAASSLIKRYKGRLRRKMRKHIRRYITPGLLTTLLPYILSQLKGARIPTSNAEYIAISIIAGVGVMFLLFY